MLSAFNLFKIARIIGILLLAVAIVLLTINTKKENNLPEGFSTPIIALEFIQNTQEVMHFFEVKNVMKYEQDLLLGNKIDYIFMTLYSCLLFCIALGIKKITNAKSMYLAILLCLVMLLSDALENHQIEKIIFYYKTASITTFLCNLYILTWLKWSSIATTFLLFFPYFLKGNLFNKTTGVLCITTFVLCIAAYFHHGILNEIFSANVVLVFLLLVIFVFTYKKPKQSDNINIPE